MSQIPTENDDNRSVAVSDFDQLDHPYEVPDQEGQPQQEQPQFGLHQNSSDWAMNTGCAPPSYYGNNLKEQKLMIQALEAKVEKLELMAKVRTLEEDVKQKANYQAYPSFQLIILNEKKRF
jgi:hypothetical protein